MCIGDTFHVDPPSMFDRMQLQSRSRRLACILKEIVVPRTRSCRLSRSGWVPSGITASRIAFLAIALFFCSVRLVAAPTESKQAAAVMVAEAAALLDQYGGNWQQLPQAEAK